METANTPQRDESIEGEPKTDEETIHDTENSDNISNSADGIVYMTGWRLQMLSIGCSLCMFLVNIEVPIVGTSLIAITNDLQGFSQAGWVVTGYLITYTSMIIIWSKISDIFGRKPATVATMSIFTIFSGACGAAQTMNQLIIFRVFQGIGAAGGVSMALIICYEMVPKHKYPAIAAQVAAAVAFGSLVGPLIGGGISEKTTWRWVFLINVPAGVVTVAILLLCIPNNFPHHGRANFVPPTWRQKFSKPSLLRLDVFGAFFLLGWTLLLVTVLLEAGTQFAWNSATSIVLLVLAGLLWICFMISERIVTNDNWPQEPIFPSRFLNNREWMGTLLISLLSGIPYNTIVIDIPQKLQAVYGVHPFEAGVRLLPFNFVLAFSSVFVNIIAGRTRIPPIYLLFVGSVLELIGIALFSTLPTIAPANIPTAMYGYQVLAGWGIGMVLGISLVIPPHVVEKRDLAISSGALLQFRVLGGALGLSIASSVLNNTLKSRLSGIIPANELSNLLQSTAVVATFSPEVQKEVLEAFLHGYKVQMQIMTGLAGLQVLLVGMLWRKKQISVVGEKLK